LHGEEERKRRGEEESGDHGLTRTYTDDMDGMYGGNHRNNGIFGRWARRLAKS
jgi:hypothetical protein